MAFMESFDLMPTVVLRLVPPPDAAAAIDAAMGNVRDIAIEVAADALQRLSGQAADDKTLADTVDRVLKAQG